MKDKTLYLFFLAATAAFVLFAIAFVYLVYAFRNRRNSEYIERQLHLRDRLQEQVEESQRLCYQVSRDIHDQVVQNVLLLGHLLHDLKRRSVQGGRFSEALDNAIALNDQLAADANHLCFSLNTDYIASHSLRELIMDELKHTLGRQGVDFQVDYRLETDLSPHHRTLVYRIVQEALRNVSRHAMATCVTVEVKEMDNSFRVTIRDNGIGISKDRIYSTGVSGIGNMRKRAAMLDGTLEIQSGRASGASVILNIGNIKAKP